MQLFMSDSKGATIWFWGGGWQILSGQIIYNRTQARPENLFPGKLRNIYFQPQQIFEKAKKKKKKKKKEGVRGGGGGGGLVRGFGRGSRIWLSMFCITFCMLVLARNIEYLVAGMFW